MTAAKAARISALAALLLAAVWLFWPSGLGGGTVYVATHGISMQPRFHTGDLAILRPAAQYRVGDVVAYRSVTLKTTVMHRIVAMDGDRFVIQGDNNSWLDPDHPGSDLVLGKLWLRIPQGGKALAALHSPGPLAGVAMAGTAFLGATRTAPRRRRRGARPRTARWGGFPVPVRARARQAALGAAVVAAVAAAGGGALLLLPVTQTETHTLPVTQQGRFSYAGTAIPGTTYPTGRITTGDAVYTKLSNAIAVTFADTVRGADPVGLNGTLRLKVSLAAGDGWTSALGSGPAVAFRAGSATTTVTVYPADAVGVLNRHYAEVGASGGSATLTVTPTVAVTGTAGGRPFAAGAPAGLAFSLDSTALRMTSTGTPLTPTTTTPVVVERTAPRAFTVLNIAVPIGIAKIAAAAVLVLALLVLAGAAWIARPPRGAGSDDAVDQFLMKHAARILPVTGFTPGSSVIDVSDAGSLHKVAERLDGLLLHQAGPDGHTFAVQDADTTYRYVLPKVPVPGPVPVTVATAEPIPAPREVSLTETAPIRLTTTEMLFGRLA
ncbi:MAG TPA: signal peptidase I [Blastococcus sp.]|nr:signal peptidase I [Blastococcus sp.]